jgi:hypothetical protein
MGAESQVTTDHEKIKKWVEDRGGKPATVAKTGDKDNPGILRIDFPGHGNDSSLKEISWEEFFEKFEEKKLAFLTQENTAGGEVSRFNKFVSRENNCN